MPMLTLVGYEPRPRRLGSSEARVAHSAATSCYSIIITRVVIIVTITTSTIIMVIMASIINISIALVLSYILLV